MAITLRGLYRQKFANTEGRTPLKNGREMLPYEQKYNSTEITASIYLYNGHKNIGK